ncbi:glycosyltransferase [Pseudooctadecabacter jejudonensis]|uniref:Putative poly(Glycerol-phosphate) alpha-glucosyltransferase n=1 Tax=Pseudooctadecabacter jejudonensis TaxID=1391910 RepID=A0A1Y5SQH8_9RHOB|nr:glycosyltransferase [Pseudooctadecabacter jejudonensis]SLN45854.1 putative poly(glycerol-phosphate) alpha-glucosyltransferase [Pseudooctadecabacter jejudonensis]
MKIAVLLPHLRTGGIERGMLSLLQRWPDDSGLEVILILQSRKGDLLDHVPPHVQVLDLQGAKVVGGSKVLAYLLHREAVDLVWTATNAANVMALLAARRMGRRRAPRLVLGEHIPLQAFLDTRRFAPLRRAIMRQLYPDAVAITAPLQPILDEHRAMIGRRCPPCVVLPNPVVDAIATARPLPDRARHFVTLGRLSPEKGYDLAIQAFAELHKVQPDARLTLHGDGPERDRLQALIARLRLGDVVTLAGAVPDAQTAFRGADMLWCTSHVEGFGNVLVEAMAHGVPVASVNCPFGPAHLLAGGRGGLLCDTRNPEQLAQQIAAFAQDRVARETAQAEGFKIAAGYTKDSAVQAHVAFFQSLSDNSDGSDTVGS